MTTKQLDLTVSERMKLDNRKQKSLDFSRLSASNRTVPDY
jgi:hypothetical protein